MIATGPASNQRLPEHRSPHPSSRASIAASLQPRRVPFAEASTRSCACSGGNQFPILRPSSLTPLTLRIPIASSGLSQPFSADSSAILRIAARWRLIVAGDRERPSKDERYLRTTERLNANLGSPQYQAINLSRCVFITPPRMHRGERIEHRRLGLFQFRDGSWPRAADRLELVFVGHKKRFL